MSENKKCIVLTGFGPFGTHNVNASWEVVKCIRDDKSLWTHDEICLMIEEIPVQYDFIKTEVPHKWTKKFEAGSWKNLAFVHVGVSHLATKLTLEKVGRNCGYFRKDVWGEIPENQQCVSSGKDEISTEFDVENFAKVVNEADCTATCEVSEDAGRYLCDFVFYQSLYHNNGKALFIHVPILDRPFTKQELAIGICHILNEIVKSS